MRVRRGKTLQATRRRVPWAPDPPPSPASSHHAYSFPYTTLENNPVFPAEESGTLRNLFADRIRRGRLWAERPREKLFIGTDSKFVPIEGEVGAGQEVARVADLRCGIRKFLLVHGSSARLPVGDEEVDFVVTDPPYFDSVQYSDLSQFFRVWLAWLLPDAVGWDYDMGGSAVGMNGASKQNRVERRSYVMVDGQWSMVAESQEACPLCTLHFAFCLLHL